MTLINFAQYVDVTIIWYFLVFNLGYTILFFASVLDILRRYQETAFGRMLPFADSKTLPPITVIVPAYNEGSTVLISIMALLKSSYANLNICVVNDGSTDNTMEILLEVLQLREATPIILKKLECSSIINYYVSDTYPYLTVISKEHTNKSDTLNVGINACTTPFFLTTDADSLIEPEAISILLYSLLSPPHTVAVGGAVNVRNACRVENSVLLETKISKSPLIAFQTCEYLRAFLFGRSGWNYFGGPLVLSGALTLFETQAVIDIGGYNMECPGEDMEIIVHLHEYMRNRKAPQNNIAFTPAASVWTDVPFSMKGLWRQRYRWHQGLIDSLVRHIGICFNSKYKAVGFFTYPFHLFGEFLAPLVEFLGYFAIIIAIYFDLLNWYYAFLFFLVSIGFATVLSMATVLISIISFNRYNRLIYVIYLLVLVLFEGIGYRQYLVVCRSAASVSYVFQKLKRKIVKYVPRKKIIS